MTAARVLQRLNTATAAAALANRTIEDTAGRVGEYRVILQFALASCIVEAKRLLRVADGDALIIETARDTLKACTALLKEKELHLCKLIRELETEGYILFDGRFIAHAHLN